MPAPAARLTARWVSLHPLSVAHTSASRWPLLAAPRQRRARGNRRFGRPGIGALVHHIRHTIFVGIGPGASVVFLRARFVGALVHIIGYSIPVGVGPGATTVFGRPWHIGALVHIVGHPIPVSVGPGNRRFRPALPRWGNTVYIIGYTVFV